MSEQPRVMRLRLADGNGQVFTAVQIPRAVRVETSGPWGGWINDSVSVLLVGTDDIEAIMVRPDEEPTT